MMEDSKLLDKIAAVARQVPSPVIADVLKTLDEATLDTSGLHIAASGIAQPAAREAVMDLLRSWSAHASRISPPALAWALRTAHHTDVHRREMQSAELVWTGPSHVQSALRNTDQVLLNLIESALESIIVVTFAAYKIPEVSASLIRAAERHVHITLVVESAEVSQGKMAFDAMRALGNAVAKASHVYVWPLEKRPRDAAGHYGSLHVKCAVADESVALISSANLTEYAMNLNMELGVLIRGEGIPKQVADHIGLLIEDGTLVRVDDSR